MFVKNAYIKYKKPSLSLYILLVHLLFLVFGIVLFSIGILMGFKEGYTTAVNDVEEGKPLMYVLCKQSNGETVYIRNPK